MGIERESDGGGGAGGGVLGMFSEPTDGRADMPLLLIISPALLQRGGGSSSVKTRQRLSRLFDRSFSRVDMKLR